MSGPLSGALSVLADANAQRESAARSAAARWTDASYRKVDSRVLRVLHQEGLRFTADLQSADVALARALALLSG